MKKFSILLLVILCLSFNIVRAQPKNQANAFKEGVYKAADFNFSPTNRYTIKNISPKDNVYLLLFDEHQLTIQSIRLDPNSEKYNLLPLKPEYRIVIVGNGEVFIA
ncbi:hypothetical protein [Clostridium vincentii]|uniref:Uncharacterized protein n=1 Tax=Clostridium vincentii TaxID=52704 RepID=A0A2T0BG06_9CLOT|nr:hypothetical protein [Clostridium vincentii]PRR82762.1 hypothetical protein CLVI_15720 [Clostridium vincentii]